MKRIDISIEPVGIDLPQVELEHVLADARIEAAHLIGRKLLEEGHIVEERQFNKVRGVWEWGWSFKATQERD